LFVKHSEITDFFMKRFHILKTATKKSDITSLTWLERCDRASTILIQFGDEITQKKSAWDNIKPTLLCMFSA